ncbi:SBBP repeat-containing protein [Sphingomonas sp. PAMC 26621]|uniref:SBBP repeat-containing protein n=1 Tax=Sphingomonas sp. PAMC 26621 TaxID=1112213 RepID=UPI0002886993|nr:SBBP repeat-containing protein [Sphingomonas sp. PAMC 26621]
MTINMSNSLAALSMLSNANSFNDYSAEPALDSRAVRTAKAQFTLAATTPPWKQAASTTPESIQISAIKLMKSIVDTNVSTPNAGSADVQTAFTAYKALDKLNLLATAATHTTATPAARVALQATFAKGLADLQTYLGQAPADKVELSFAQSTRHAGTVSFAASDPLKFTGTGILDARDTPLPGLTGTETFQVSLNKPSASDTLTIDLSKTVQPPTLDSVSNAINAAITAIPARNPDGSVALDNTGNTKPRWLVHFVPDKSSGRWGFSVQAPNGTEQVSIDQVGGGDALVVATGRAALDAPTTTQILRFNDAAGAMTRTSENTIAAIDSAATARAKLTAAAPAKGVTAAPVVIQATTTTQAIATDRTGSSYVVGTTTGDLQSNRSNGSSDLFLTKLDSEGAVVWQRSLGASGEAQGAAISVGANGDITVAGTVSGSFDGSSSDGDMLVARYTAQGDESFTTVVHELGADTAHAIAVGTDGSIYVGGKSASNGGDAFLARLDATGKLKERRTIDGADSQSVTALAIGQDGNVLALTNESGDAKLREISASDLSTDLSSLALGHADARALAVASDGSIAVAGATNSALGGTQANAMGSGRDGFVTRINAALTSVTTTYLTTAGDDQVDSVAFMNGALYVGGRTTGDLGGARRGPIDGFVSRLDATSGAVQDITQFGQVALRTEPVRIAATTGGDTVLGALGLHRGVLNPPASTSLVAQTSLRAGDEFSLRINGGAPKKIVILADDTLKTLGDRIRRITGAKATVTVSTTKGTLSLSIDAKAGSKIALVAGASGKDALAKLGLDPSRLSVPVVVANGAPKIHPGGNFGLALTEALNVSTAKDAAATLSVLKNAISTTQTAYRSLYWDATKAALTDGSSASTALTPAQAAQLASYQSALARLTPAADTTVSTYLTGV